MHRHRKLVGFLAATSLAVSMAGPATLGTASADPKVSTLVASPAAVSLDVVNAPTSATVNVALDQGCSNAFNVGQTYTVTASSRNTGVATASGSPSGALHCAGDNTKNGSQLVATFGISAVCAGTTAVDFTPVAGPNGLQKKLAGTSIPVTVTNVTGATCAGGGGSGGERPAAPAVANGYLNAQPSAYAACKATFSTVYKNSWRGALINQIASWMPKPESIKDNTSAFPDAGDWVNYVRSEVNHKCGISEPDFPIPGGFGLPGYVGML